MATVAAARSFLRSSAAKSSALSGASRFSAGAASKPNSNPFSQSPFQLPKQKSLSSRCIFRSPVELSCCVESLMPYHTATASALLTSMLSDACRHCWTSEDCNDDV